MSTYGTDDAVYGIGTFGTAVYGQASPDLSVSGVGATVTVQQPNLNIFEIDVTEVIFGSGLDATGAVGSLTLTGLANKTPTSVSATASPGTPEPQVSKEIDGTTATSSAGSLVVNISDVPDGVSATFTINAAGLDIRSINFVPVTTSADATGSIGTLAISNTVTLSGVDAVLSVPSVEPQPTEAVASVSATGSIGTTSPSGKAFHELDSVSGIISVGVAETQPTEKIPGVVVVGSISSVQINMTEVLESVSSTASTNTLTVSGVDNPIAIADRDHRREVYVLPQKNRIVFVVSQVA